LALVYFSGGELGIPEFSSYSLISCSVTQKSSGAYSYYHNGTGYIATQNFPTSYTALYLSFAFYPTTFGGNQVLFNLRKDGVSIASVRSNGTGNPYYLYVGGSLLGTATIKPVLNSWQIIELYINVATAGLAILRINGFEEARFTGITNTAGDSINQFYIDSANWNGYIDDIVVNDTTGNINNSWMGGTKIVSLRPIGPGAFTQWTPSVGSNWDCVNETPPSSTDFVTSNVLGALDLYDLDTLPAGVTGTCTVYGVKVANVAVRAGVTVAYLKNVIRTDGSNTTSLPFTLGLTEVVCPTIFDLNPVSGLTWTYSNVNALECGAQVA
jgi:hypothetical protein